MNIADLVVVCCAPIAEGVLIQNDDAIRDVGWVTESGPILQSDHNLRTLPRCLGLPNFVPECLAIPSQWENETAQGAGLFYTLRRSRSPIAVYCVWISRLRHETGGVSAPRIATGCLNIVILRPVFDGSLVLIPLCDVQLPQSQCDHVNDIATLCSSAIQFDWSRFWSVVPQSGMGCERGPILGRLHSVGLSGGLKRNCDWIAWNMQFRHNSQD